MKSTRFVSAVAALSMGLSSLAFAVPNEPPGGWPGNREGAQPVGRDDHGRPGPGRDDRGRPGPGRDDHGRPGYSRDDRRGPPPAPVAYRGAHDWHRGDRLPPEYRGRQYVVDDWRGHRLSAPPRGYQWVQAGGDYVLAAIATGVIASILLNQ